MWEIENDNQNKLIGRPLVFGDTEQIKAIKLIRKEREDQEKARQNDLIPYKVTVHVDGIYETEVSASCEEEAQEIALNEFQGEMDSCIDLSFDVKEIEQNC